MNRQERMWTAIVLGAFVVVFLVLTISSYTQQSATIDEPQHLTAGYATLTLRDYRVDPEHPPFLRMWATLPLLAMHGLNFDIDTLNRLPANPMVSCHEFLYEKNDADRLLYRARLMIVLLGVLLGVFLFRWAQELYGFWPAVIVLALYTTEPNILAHASLVTTDLGVACFMFATLYFLRLANRQLTLKNIALLIIFFALAQISKFSALTLWPILLVLFVIRVLLSRPWPCSIGSAREFTSRTSKALVAAFIAASLLLASFAATWAVYGFRYAPAAGSSRLPGLPSEPVVITRVPPLAEVFRWIDRQHLLPNACTQGFLLGQARAENRLTFLAGQTTKGGWWYYFPIAFLIKTPVALLLLFFGGFVLVVVRRDAQAESEVFILVPAAAYMAIAIMTNLNVGLRHILLIYPFVLLVAGKAAAQLWTSRWKMLRVVLAALCLFQVEEVAIVYPHYLAFFNQFIGGPQNGYKWLADSNLDWGQDLKGLKKWMDKNGVQFVNLSYFGLADPAYYGINCSYLYPSPFFGEGRDGDLHLPGYVVVSEQNLLGVSVDPPRPDLYKKLLESKPVAVIGYSIYVYWVDRPWW